MAGPRQSARTPGCAVLQPKKGTLGHDAPTRQSLDLFPCAPHAFGAEVKNTNQYTDEQRKDYIGGIVERIDVKWLKEPRQHELTITFRLPIVGDRIEWKNSKQKSQGYTLVEGQKTDVVTLSKRDGRG